MLQVSNLSLIYSLFCCKDKNRETTRIELEKEKEREVKKTRTHVEREEEIVKERKREFGDRSLGLMVMGDISCLRDCGFESRCRIQDGHDIFSHLFVIKIVLFVWKGRK